MSKMDNLRAMREAKYAENAKRAGQPAAKAAKTAAAKTTAASGTATPRTRKAPAPVAPPAAGAADELCGHRNMSGRSCTREQGHAAKSHRYS